MPSILVIDDDPNIRIIFQKMLTMAGYRVLTAADGKQGVRLFRDQGADLVITDLIMPEQEGLETICELHRDFPDLDIIVISGGGRFGEPSSYLYMAKRFGARYSFQKPVPSAKLLAAVRELIGPGEQ